MEQIKAVPLKRNHICPCGYGVLKDSIPLGTVYELDLSTIQGGFRYVCGGCKREQYDVRIVFANEPLNPAAPRSPLPYDLFVDAV